jgi:hypothetical protein
MVALVVVSVPIGLTGAVRVPPAPMERAAEVDRPG